MKRRWHSILVILVVLTMLFTACAADTTTKSTTAATTTETESTVTTDSTESMSAVDETDLENISVEYKDTDKDDTYDEATATKISLADGATEIDGDGATVSGNVVTITSAGEYILSGSLTDGQIVVNADKEDVVQLILNNVSVTNSTGSAVYVEQAEKVVMTLPEGTVSTLSDTARAEDADTSEDSDETDDNAAIYAGDDLSFNGSGTLNINGNYKHGVKTVDDLVITGGTINITAVKEGLRGKDSVAILDGNITIEAREDGIQSSNGDDENSGWVSIDGGTLKIEAGDNGITAETVLLISAGNLDITASQDTLHSNGSIKIDDGTLVLSAEDDGAHADNTLMITGGNITVLRSYEALEGADIAISGGVMLLNAQDDGINAAGGSDNGGFDMGGGQMPGQDRNTDSEDADETDTTDSSTTSSMSTDGITEMVSGGPDAVSGASEDSADGGPGGGMTERGGDSFGGSGDYLISISGGYIYICVETGDGVDSNGDIEISGGTLVVDGPTSNANAAIDMEQSSFTVSGGNIAAAGSSGMLVIPTEATQAVVTIVFDQQQAAGDAVTLTDNNGNVIMSVVPENIYQSLMLSSAELELNQTYKIAYGGTVSGNTEDGTYYTEATLTGAEKTISFELTSTTLIIDQDGNETTYTSQMGGGKTGGGMQPGGGFFDGSELPDGAELPSGDAMQPPNGGGGRPGGR